MFPSTAAAAKLPRETTLRTYGKRKVAVVPHSFVGLGVSAAPPPAVKAPPARTSTILEIHDPFSLPNDNDTDPIEARLKRIRTGTSKAAAPARVSVKSKKTLFDYPFADKSPVRKPTAAARRRKLKEQEDADWKPDVATAKKALRKPRRTKKAAVESTAPYPAPEEAAPSATSTINVAPQIAVTVPTTNDDDVAPIAVSAPTSASNDAANALAATPLPSTPTATPSSRRRSLVQPRVLIPTMSRSPAVASPRNLTLPSHPPSSATRTTTSPAPTSPLTVSASPRAPSPMLDVAPSTDSGLADLPPQGDDMDVDPTPLPPPLSAVVDPIPDFEPLLDDPEPVPVPDPVPTLADPPLQTAMAIDWDAPFTFTAEPLAVTPASSPRAPLAPTVLRSSPARAPPSPPTHSLLEPAHGDDDAMDVDPAPLVLVLADTPQPAVPAPVPAPSASARDRTDSGVGDDMPTVPDTADEASEDDDDDDRNVPFFLSPHAADGASSSDDDEFENADSPLANRSVAVPARTAPVPSGLQQLVALSPSPPSSPSGVPQVTTPAGHARANGAGQPTSLSPVRNVIVLSPGSDVAEQTSADAAQTPQVSSVGLSAVGATPLSRFDLTSPSSAPRTGLRATSFPGTPAPALSSRALFTAPATPASSSLPHTLTGLLQLCALSRSSTTTAAPVSFDDTLFGGRTYRPRPSATTTSFVTKIGEASYSDVYLVRRPTKAPRVADGTRETVVKIMPFAVPDPRTPTPARRTRAAVLRDRRMSVAAIRRAEPGTPVRGRPPTVVEDETDAPEMRDVAMLVPELAVALRVGRVPGFLPTVQVDVVRAPAPGSNEGYHPALLAAFDAFAVAVPHVAWNPRPPAVVRTPMWYCVVHMPHGGIPLEDAEVRDVWSCLVQIARAVGLAERECEFEHRDLHWGNVLVDSDEVCRVIDFTFARCLDAGGGVQFAPIPEHVFEGDEDEDEQFAVYRRMREVVERGGKRWSGYYPRTNVLWLQYLARKLVIKTDDAQVQKALMDVADRLASVPTAADAVPVIEGAMAAAAVGKGRSA
ncbi:hypothetical protein AMAG_17418 [Allomyces macrogynus ATCC 38327]|uniref:non-specific serine/threonine protein kinase n=1 Tax=Allomyces macrogynus (strain ATCC 38327) TaxID=578462 RepID=A0A0L0TER6_ALLM3|nr:hypothetical protein AMAG_17418 [Allomyces macrogynus ATCC 38327]|eukprot:KNE73237.1 hypothetical protein AMAG_17418 [Allomyces macrogynus ATCC 38327]